VTDYFFPDEKENGKDSIVSPTVDGSLVELFQEDISSIKITDTLMMKAAKAEQNHWGCKKVCHCCERNAGALLGSL